MTAYSPLPLAVLAATLNMPSSSVSSVSPLLAALIVGSTKTSNDDFDVLVPAVPAATSAVTSAKQNAKRTRLIFPLLAAPQKRLSLSPRNVCHNRRGGRRRSIRRSERYIVTSATRGRGASPTSLGWRRGRGEEARSEEHTSELLSRGH